MVHLQGIVCLLRDRLSPSPAKLLLCGLLCMGERVCACLCVCVCASNGMFCKIRSDPHIKVGRPFCLLLLCVALSLFRSDASTTFSYNGFDAGAQVKITCYNNASFASESMQLTLPGATKAYGRCLYNTPIQFLQAGRPLSFSTQFIFKIDTGTGGLADGVAFIIAPALAGVAGSIQGYLGIFNDDTNGKISTHTLAIEFDTYRNPEYEDQDDNHVGIDVNDIVSWETIFAAYRTSSWPTIRNASDGYTVQMKGQNVQVWIDYDGSTNQLNISVSRVLGSKPPYPLISNSSLNLSSLFNEEMYVGFSASTGPLTDVLYHVYAWSFSSNGSLAVDVSLPSEGHNSKDKKAIILGATFSALATMSVMFGLLLVYLRKRRLEARHLNKDEWQLSLEEHLPQQFSYRELAKATCNFDPRNRLGCGGFGEVFQGVIPSSGVAVAVKRISKDSKQGVREFVSEVTTIGRLRHRNLVPLLGWCQEKGFMLVYELMPHGSLDKYLFNDQETLPWNQRLHILQGVAAALLYLHEECEQKIVHRDIKASNVMLDSQMNARLGDFGLARLYGHDVVPSTTNVAGTWGYMAPESFFTRKATEKTDVFSFGALVLEVVTGEKMSGYKEKEGCCTIEWLWKLQKNGALEEAVGPLVLGSDNQEFYQMVKVALELGLLCCYPDPDGRPSMRRIVQVLGGDALPPPLPSVMPSPYLFSSLALSSATQVLTTASAPSNSDDSSSFLIGHSLSVPLETESFKDGRCSR